MTAKKQASKKAAKKAEVKQATQPPPIKKKAAPAPTLAQQSPLQFTWDEMHKATKVERNTWKITKGDIEVVATWDKAEGSKATIYRNGAVVAVGARRDYYAAIRAAVAAFNDATTLAA